MQFREFIVAVVRYRYISHVVFAFPALPVVFFPPILHTGPYAAHMGFDVTPTTSTPTMDKRRRQHTYCNCAEPTHGDSHITNRLHRLKHLLNGAHDVKFVPAPLCVPFFMGFQRLHRLSSFWASSVIYNG